MRQINTMYLGTTGSETLAHHQNLIQSKSSALNPFKALTLFKIKTKDQELNRRISD